MSRSDGKKVAKEDEKYRYPLFVSRSLMQDYMHMCKKMGTTSPARITLYMQQELKKNKGKY